MQQSEHTYTINKTDRTYLAYKTQCAHKIILYCYTEITYIRTYDYKLTFISYKFVSCELEVMI